MRLAAAGDVMLGRNAGAILRRQPPECVWGDTLPLLRAADAVVVNLECVIAREETGAPWPGKVFHFKAPPEAVAALRAARVGAVTLANNHTLDFGAPALEEMLGALPAAGIVTAGAGRTGAEARRVATLEAQGMRLALISFTDNEPGWEAAAGSPGVYYLPVDLRDPRAEDLLEAVRDAGRDHDLVIVAAHWGPNMVAAPLPRHRAFAHALADAGAHLLLGTSAHVVQGIELYPARSGRVVPICYDLGDYVDDYAVDPALRNDRSFLFTFEVERGGVRRITLAPVLIDGWQGRVDLAEGADAAETMATMAARCRELGTAVARTGQALTVAVPAAAA